ncbi:MAG: OmpH family outer membrane protein [Desulfovibrionaceae bacterium]
MRKVLFLAVALAMVLQVPAFAADLKLAVIHMERLKKASEPGKYITGELKKKLDPMVKERQRLENELKQLSEDFKNKSAAYSLDTKREKELELKRKYRDLEDLRRDIQQKAVAEDKTLSEPVLEMMQQVAEKYIEEQNYDLVLEYQQSGILYLGKALDITDELIKRVNQAWKAKGH